MILRCTVTEKRRVNDGNELKINNLTAPLFLRPLHLISISDSTGQKISPGMSN